MGGDSRLTERRRYCIGSRFRTCRSKCSGPRTNLSGTHGIFSETGGNGAISPTPIALISFSREECSIALRNGSHVQQIREDFSESGFQSFEVSRLSAGSYSVVDAPEEPGLRDPSHIIITVGHLIGSGDESDVESLWRKRFPGGRKTKSLHGVACRIGTVLQVLKPRDPTERVDVNPGAGK